MNINTLCKIREKKNETLRVRPYLPIAHDSLKQRRPMPRSPILQSSLDGLTTNRVEFECFRQRRHIKRLRQAGVHANICITWLHQLSIVWPLPNKNLLGRTSIEVVQDLTDSITDGTNQSSPRCSLSPCS